LFGKSGNPLATGAILLQSDSMDISSKKLAALLDDGQPTHVRAAAVIVCGELGLKDGDLTPALLARLDDAEATVRIAAIRAVGLLKLGKATPTLLERIKSGGEEASLAADAVVKLGADAIRKLQDLLHHVVPGVRKYIASALTSVTSGSGEVGVTVLLDKDPLIASSASKAMISRVPNMTAAEKKKLVAEAVAMASDKKRPMPASAESPFVRLLASLNDPTAADILWDRTIPPYSNEVRGLALGTVGGWLSTPTKEQWRRLFLCANERDFSVAAPALVLLSKLNVTDKQAKEWEQLYDAPDAAARRLAIDKLGHRDTAENAAMLYDQVSHTNRDLRDVARAKLAEIDHGRKLLVKAVLDAKNADEAWSLARTIVPFAKKFPPKLREEILKHACVHLEADDHRSDALFFLLKESDAASLRDQLFEQAVAKRKKKQYESALKHLKWLTRDPAMGFAMRLELGLVGLRLSAKNVAEDRRAIDPCLRNIGTTINQDAAKVTDEITKAKWLETEDLAYLGFHFSEMHGPEKEFGVAMLRAVLKASPKSKLGSTAKNKLKQIGVK
jgi:HEAT repeats